MRWESVNAMTFESPTHRVRRVGEHWLAEVKPSYSEPSTNKKRVHIALRKIPGVFATQVAAQEACEADAYKTASGR